MESSKEVNDYWDLKKIIYDNEVIFFYFYYYNLGILVSNGLF